MRNVIFILVILICSNAFGQKVKVLNFATFHMTYTPDAHKVKFDQHDAKNRSEIYAIAKMLAEFKPTIICVEIVPARQEELDNDYAHFIKDKDYNSKLGGEIALVAYEIGKMAGVQKIYGIDEQETALYNYNIGHELENQVDSLTGRDYYNKISKEFAGLGKLSVLDQLKTFNDKATLEKFININADILTYSSTKGNFEGADEASKFYRRNLRIFSNLNQVPVTPDDRIFIIMGATHTAFLQELMQRSPKYQLVPVADYLR
ncbi:DUF5694 domain-containing protein [Taibaiella chishuiensis]|uniref:TraB family protein n=1 Tax=Taibaiella chishuiensis TaxID=1434707 RepID=A0A2P8CVC9_9BACT|nr:DUF5694 domain-containing protein [Taibaiella chishuiensis]PSK88912.1 hypothetical protein B0I18_114124 [Taibaiella chishuiensis]